MPLLHRPLPNTPLCLLSTFMSADPFRIFCPSRSTKTRCPQAPSRTALIQDPICRSNPLRGSPLPSFAEIEAAEATVELEQPTQASLVVADGGVGKNMAAKWAAEVADGYLDQAGSGVRSGCIGRSSLRCEAAARGHGAQG